MLVTSSQSVRSLVVRLNKGEDLAESLASLITSQRITVATVQGHGALEAVILDSYDARARTYGDARTFTGRLELISLQGHLSTREGHPDLYLHAAVARDTGNGVEVLGGRLIEAQVVAVELTLLLHDDLHLERTPETTGIPTWRTGSAAKAPKIVGGSTITQQLAKNLLLSGERTLLRKGQEFVLTMALELLLSKQRILEIYLNHVEWGEGVFGAEAAAQHYYRKPASKLSAYEAARLAVMLPRPKYFEKVPNSGYLSSRAGTIVARMGDAVLP